LGIITVSGLFAGIVWGLLLSSISGITQATRIMLYAAFLKGLARLLPFVPNL
jgi:hypothetical protein